MGKLFGINKFLVAALVALTAASVSLAVPPSSASAASPNAAKIRNDTRSTKMLRVCKDRVSQTQCGVNSWTSLLGQGSTTWWDDADGYWCPPRSVCSDIWRNAYNPSYSSSSFVAMPGCYGCTVTVKISNY